MSKFLFYISLILCSCNSQDEKHDLKINCDKFKTGTFFNLVQGDTTLYRIDRNDTIQKETIVRTGEFANLKIKWTSQCEYELSFLNQNFMSGDSISTENQKEIAKVKILRVEKDSCFVVSVDKNNNNPQFGVVFIDKKSK